MISSLLNKKKLSEKHYIIEANTENHLFYWFIINFALIKQYEKDYHDDFCIVIICSAKHNDAYILPFQDIKNFLPSKYIEYSGAYLGTIDNSTLKLELTHSCKPLSIERYYNAFHLLNLTILNNKIIEDEKIDYKTLQNEIKEFNDKYMETVPEKRRIISEEIERPNNITNCLKRYHNYTCQICTIKGFLQKNGSFYIEAHHIEELHKLIKGSYCSDNLIIVCPTCHKKLHFADVNYVINTNDNFKITIKINDDVFEVQKNIISLE